MSRAFVKEPDGDQVDDAIPERPQSEHPNYITLAGLELLQQRLQALYQEKESLQGDKEDLAVRNRIQWIERDLRYYQQRLDRAIPVDISGQAGDEIRFGATVTLLDTEGRQLEFTIVGEDEAEVDAGRISWVSPLARALLGRRVGDTVIWPRPAGDVELEIADFRYGP